MRTLKTREAASLLNVSPNTLRTWERKFGYPSPVRSPGGHRAYTYAEITALSDALKRGLAVESAISAVRESLGADFEALVNAIDSFSYVGADRAMEASLALRSMERSVDEVLLPALVEVRRRHGPRSTKWAVAHRWSIHWLNRAQRLAPPADVGPGILLADATAGQLSPTGPVIHALELFCRRDGLRVLALPVEAVGGLQEAVATIDPLCLLIAGADSNDADVEQWAYTVRRIAGALPAAIYLRPMNSNAANPLIRPLSGGPIEAHQQLLAVVDAGSSAKRAALGDEVNRLAQNG